MPDPAIVLLNLTADHGRAASLRRPIERWLTHRAPNVPLLAPTSADAALATLMVLAPRTRVVVVGGDGSVHALLPAFLRHGHRLGLVPAGRQNHLAHLLGVAGFGWRKALAYALKAPTAPIDIGQVQTEQLTEHFATSLTAGLEAQLAAPHAQPPWPLAALGRQAHTSYAAWFARRPTETRIWVDGRLEHEGVVLSCAVLNTGESGPARDLAPLPRLDDARLELRIVQAVGALTAGRLLADIAADRPVRHAAVHWRAGERVLIDANGPLAVAIDGEPQLSAQRITVQVLPRAVHVAGAHVLAPPHSR